MAGRTKAFAKNAWWSLLLQVVAIVAGFLVPHAIIESYGSIVNGLVSSLTQLVSYMALVEAGISAASVFALYKPLAEGDKTKINIILSATKRFYYRSGIIFTILAVGLAVAYPLLVDCAGIDDFQVIILTLSLCATNFLDFFMLAKYRALLTASQRNWIIQLATILYRVLYVVVVLVLAGIHVSIEIVYLVAIVPVLLRSLLLAFYTRRAFPDARYDVVADEYKLDQRWDAFFIQVLGAVQSGFPILVATFVLQDLNIVSIFSVYLLVGNGIQSLCGTIGNGTQASFGDVIARGEIAKLQRAYREMSALVGLVNAVACAVATVMITPFVAVYTAGITDINYVMPLLGILVMANVFFYQMKTPEGLLVIAAGKYRESKPYVVVQAAILIMVSSIGAVAWGIEGIVLGAILSNIYAAIYLLFFVTKHVTFSPRREVLKRYAVTMLSYAPCIPLAASGLVRADGWESWIVECLIAVVAAGCFGGLVFLVFERGQVIGLINRGRNLLGRDNFRAKTEI